MGLHSVAVVNKLIQKEEGQIYIKKKTQYRKQHKKHRTHKIENKPKKQENKHKKNNNVYNTVYSDVQFKYEYWCCNAGTPLSFQVHKTMHSLSRADCFFLLEVLKMLRRGFSPCDELILRQSGPTK